MILLAILLFAAAHPEVIEPSIPIVTIIGATFSFIASISMIIFSFWLKSSSDRKYAEQQQEKKDEQDEFKIVKKQVYENKENILRNTIYDEKNVEDNKRMQASVDKVAKNIEKLTGEVNAVKELMIQIKAEKEAEKEAKK
jgi:hypothetical protein